MKTEDNSLNIFRLLRIARDKKVKDVAKELGVTPAYINAIETGDRFPSERLLRDYANALDVSVETITSFEPSKNGSNVFERVLLSLLQKICSIGETTQ